MILCLLSLDLSNTGEVQRVAFCKVLKDDNWKRFRNADATWEKSYELAYDALVEKRVKTLLEAAANMAGIEELRFVVQAGEQEGWCCQLEKIHGIYHFTTFDSAADLKKLA